MYKPADKSNTNTGAAVLCWLTTLAYMGLLFYLSSRSSFHLPKLPENSDKVIHICLYGPLAYLLFLSLRESGFRRNIFITAVVIAAVYGISDEFHQYFVPGRDASAWDVLADLTGAFLGSVGASIRKPRDLT